MNPADYDAWYDTARGRWIGETECRLLISLLDAQVGESALDVGCGTGWFTRRIGGLTGSNVTGVDLNGEWLAFARNRDMDSIYLQADARDLPFAEDSFDRIFSVTALSFVPDWKRALREILRVTSKRFVIGLLNRNSLLWSEKGRNGGEGAYRGAHWHTRQEIRSGLIGLPACNIKIHSAIFMPSGSRIARMVEPIVPGTLACGSFLVVSGDKLPNCRQS